MSFVEKNGWEIDEPSMNIICSYIDEFKPKVIVELGSGHSTWEMSQHLGNNGIIISLEDSPEFLERSKKIIGEPNSMVQSNVVLIYAPIIDGWYDLTNFPKDVEIDMLVVDGPPGGSAEMARYPAVPLLQERIVGPVFLHDTNREDERKIAEKWGENGKVTFYDTPDGLARIDL